jgi:hypothetical protein
VVIADSQFGTRTVKEQHDVRPVLSAAELSQSRALVDQRGSRTGQLHESKDRYVQVVGNGTQLIGNVNQMFVEGLSGVLALDALEVVDDKQSELPVGRQTAVQLLAERPDVRHGPQRLVIDIHLPLAVCGGSLGQALPDVRRQPAVVHR